MTPQAVTPQAVTAREVTPLAGIVLITGTDTGVGKTIATAAIAAAATAQGLRVVVIKPAQTGVDPAYGEIPDAEVVHRLADPAGVHTLANYPDPLAPLAAARVAQLPELELAATADQIKELAAGHDLVLVEGAGGLLVPMGRTLGGEIWTVVDLAVVLDAQAVVVARAGLGTLNHTALTMQALKHREITGYVLVGAWPDEPDLVHFANLVDLPAQLHGLLPDGAGAMEPGVFRRSAPGWLTPTLYGNCDDPRELAYTDDD